MRRKNIKIDTLKVLFARSGNECAFPGCNHPVFNDDDLYVAQLCHIEAVSKGGPRYNASQTEEERHHIDNLMFLCYRHHKETDNVKEFPTERLKKIKEEHENKFTEMGKEASNGMIHQILSEINYFWNKQKSKKYELSELKIERNFNLTIDELFEELVEIIKSVQNYCDLTAESDSYETIMNDLKILFEKLGLNFVRVNEIPYYENPFINRNWELHNLGRPNLFSHLSLCILQLKIKVYEELLKYNPDNTELLEQVQKSRYLFEEYYDKSYYFD